MSNEDGISQLERLKSKLIAHYGFTKEELSASTLDDVVAVYLAATDSDVPEGGVDPLATSANNPPTFILPSEPQSQQSPVNRMTAQPTVPSRHSQPTHFDAYPTGPLDAHAVSPPTGAQTGRHLPAWDGGRHYTGVGAPWEESIQTPLPHVSASTKGRRRTGAKKAWIALGAVGFLLCVALAVWFAVSQESSGVAASVSASREPPRLEAAVDACGSRDVDDTITLADAGATIVVDTGSKYGDVGGLNCLLAELNTPQSLTAQLGSTTALMGVQDANHDGLSYSWSYHPDNGVNMIITDSELETSG